MLASSVFLTAPLTHFLPQWRIVFVLVRICQTQWTPKLSSLIAKWDAWSYPSMIYWISWTDWVPKNMDKHFKIVYRVIHDLSKQWFNAVLKSKELMRGFLNIFKYIQDRTFFKVKLYSKEYGNGSKNRKYGLMHILVFLKIC